MRGWLTAFDAAIQASPGDGQAWLQKASFLARAGQHRHALKCFDRSLELDECCYEAWIGKAISLIRSGYAWDALGCFDRAIAIEPYAHEAYYCKGQAFELVGRHGEAMECYSKSTRVEEDYIRGYRAMAMLRMRTRDTQGAIGDLDTALEINQDDTISHAIKAVALLDMGKADEALLEAEQAIRVTPKAVAYEAYGKVLAAMGKHKKAIHNFDIAIVLYAQFGEITDLAHLHYVRALSLFEREEYARAAEDIRTARKAGLIANPRFVEKLSLALGEDVAADG
jgi:tetratricopeptide (TPR) repeat protein